MKILSGLLLMCVFLFSLELTPTQLQLLNDSGYAKTATNVSSKNIKKVQAVKNDISPNKTQVKTNPKAKIQRYGSLFFNNKNKINPYSIPIPSNYKLNFADKLSLTIYGAKNENFELPINKNGRVIIPQVGELKVIGLTFSEVKKLVLEESRKAYPNSTSILVDIAEFSSIQVTISGLVQAPGFYNLSSFSTIKDALHASGGILDNGSYRKILLKRDGKVHGAFDLYKLIRYGDTNTDFTLESGDVILVPPLIKQIKLTGAVNYSAYFELKEDESFKDLHQYAAGFKPSANKNAITLKRYENNSVKVYTLGVKDFSKIIPQAGDEIHVYSTSIIAANLIKISGNIVAPGEKPLPKDKSLSSFIQNELERFGKNAYFKNDTNYTFAIIENDNNIKSFNLEDIINQKSDVLLKIGDTITIFKNTDLKEKPLVYVQAKGLKLKQEQYSFSKGLTLQSLFDMVLFTGKKTSDNIDTSKIKITRSIDGIKNVFMVDINQQSNFMLHPSDEITFYDYEKVNTTKSATIQGEVFIPDTYAITKNTTINDLVKLAGGVTSKVLMARCEIARYEVKNYKRIRTIHTLDLSKILALNFKILPDDEVTIFPIANWNDKIYVNIAGQVRYPGRYAIVDGEKLSSLLLRAGGFLNNAFMEGVIFTREEVRLLQEKRLDESLDRLKGKALQVGASANEAGEKSEDKKRMLESIAMIEKEAEKNKPIGRISLNMYHDLNRFIGSKYDITLKNNDKLYIPTMVDTVSVVGEVLNQATFVYDKDIDATNYLEKAGGVTELANDDYIYIVKANGEAKKYSEHSFFSEGKEVFKGDTIVVPLKLDTVSDIAFAKDVTTVLYQLAITAASLQTLGAI